MSDNAFTCAMCRKTFEKGWTDAEAEAELSEVFGDAKTEDCGTVCDPCYQSFMRALKS